MGTLELSTVVKRQYSRVVYQISQAVFNLGELCVFLQIVPTYTKIPKTCKQHDFNGRGREVCAELTNIRMYPPGYVSATGKLQVKGLDTKMTQEFNIRK